MSIKQSKNKKEAATAVYGMNKKKKKNDIKSSGPSNWRRCPSSHDARRCCCGCCTHRTQIPVRQMGDIGEEGRTGRHNRFAAHIWEKIKEKLSLI